MDDDTIEDLYLSGGTTADQDFIAHARQDIPLLLGEIERLKKILAYILLVSLIASCNPFNSIKPPAIDIPEASLNEEIVLDFPRNLNDFKIGKYISLDVILKQDILLLRGEKNWIETVNQRANLIKKINGKEIPKDMILGKGEGETDIYRLDINPEIENNGNPIPVFILVQGEVFENGKSIQKTVGAYKILRLYP